MSNGSGWGVENQPIPKRGPTKPTTLFHEQLHTTLQDRREMTSGSLQRQSYLWDAVSSTRNLYTKVSASYHETDQNICTWKRARKHSGRFQTALGVKSVDDVAGKNATKWIFELSSWQRRMGAAEMIIRRKLQMAIDRMFQKGFHDAQPSLSDPSS